MESSGRLARGKFAASCTTKKRCAAWKKLVNSSKVPLTRGLSPHQKPTPSGPTNQKKSCPITPMENRYRPMRPWRMQTPITPRPRKQALRPAMLPPQKRHLSETKVVLQKHEQFAH